MRADRIKCASKPGCNATSRSTPWSAIISALVRGCGCAETSAALRRERAVPAGAGDSACERGVRGSLSDAPEMVTTSALVRVLERRSENSVIILWQDATRCHYGDQVWCRCRSARTGICALSGNAIRRGDPIYRPRRGAFPPANAQAMILASALEGDGQAGDWAEEQR